MSCLSTSLCVAVDVRGHAVISTDPTVAVPTWRVATIDGCSGEAILTTTERLAHSGRPATGILREFVSGRRVVSLDVVGVREFRDHATKYLAGPETVAVNRHGRVIGFYIPLKRDEYEVRRAVAQLGQAVSRYSMKPA